jgi:putative DNA methylase
MACNEAELSGRRKRAIEDGFPFDELSDIAEIESWRKEIYRPIYHIHKWWAQRLGSVFRAAIVAGSAPQGHSIMDLFYEPLQLPDVVVFDPFMGNGTTIGEAHKLGCAAIGRDINPVAFRSVSASLDRLDRRRLQQMFDQVAGSVKRELLDLYRSYDREGNECDVLYYFWVKVLPCPACSAMVDLFSNYVFAKHAYVKRYPQVQVLCPDCGEVNRTTYDVSQVTCARCNNRFDPHKGPARNTTASCTSCGHEFPIAKTARAAGKPPDHRLYAKLILKRDGTKEYLSANEQDVLDYKNACEKLGRSQLPLPKVPIHPGYNTKQILNYGYKSWHELFNARQLYALTTLANSIRALPDSPEQRALATLFSGVLEFNNIFVSFKGEGTGAVRHMFAHHILKPERVPIEANVWGTSKSSGSFSTLYQSRLLRAIKYREAPFEIAIDTNGSRLRGRKVFGISPPMGATIVKKYPNKGLAPGQVYLSCGSSTKTDIPDKTVDLVVTDPPFFDNVHYSELADFFYVWQKLYFDPGPRKNRWTTRHELEVQDTDAESFANKLQKVFEECHRVLQDDGLLIFSYHHSKEDGWVAVARALLGAGFSFVQSQPVKSEMSVATPKNQAKEPIDLDVLLVCRKQSTDDRESLTLTRAVGKAIDDAQNKIRRFNKKGRKLSKNDIAVVVVGQLLVELSASRTFEQFFNDLQTALPEVVSVKEKLAATQKVENRAAPREYLLQQSLPL